LPQHATHLGARAGALQQIIAVFRDQSTPTPGRSLIHTLG